MKRILNAISIGWLCYRKPGTFHTGTVTMLQAITDTLDESTKAGRPMMRHVGFAAGEDPKSRLLTLWCGTGVGTPVERIAELAKENIELRNIIVELKKSQNA